MKKIALLFVGLMASGAASALQFESTGPFRMTDCTLLNEDVTITLTTGVKAGVACDTTTNQIGIATCHIAGRTATRSAEKEECVTNTDGTQTCTPVVETVEGPAMPTATTRFGTVRTEFPTGTCDAGAAEGLATTKAAEG